MSSLSINRSHPVVIFKNNETVTLLPCQKRLLDAAFESFRSQGQIILIKNITPTLFKEFLAHYTFHVIKKYQGVLPELDERVQSLLSTLRFPLESHSRQTQEWLIKSALASLPSLNEEDRVADFKYLSDLGDNLHGYNIQKKTLWALIGFADKAGAPEWYLKNLFEEYIPKFYKFKPLYNSALSYEERMNKFAVIFEIHATLLMLDQESHLALQNSFKFFPEAFGELIFSAKNEKEFTDTIKQLKANNVQTINLSCENPFGGAWSSDFLTKNPYLVTEGLKSLDLVELQGIENSGLCTQFNLQFLRGLPIRQLDLSTITINEMQAQTLATMPLESFILRNGTISEKAMRMIAFIPSLRQILIEECQGVDPLQIVKVEIDIAKKALGHKRKANEDLESKVPAKKPDTKS